MYYLGLKMQITFHNKDESESYTLDLRTVPESVYISHSSGESGNFDSEGLFNAIFETIDKYVRADD